MLFGIILGVLFYLGGMYLDKMYRDKLKDQGQGNSYEAQFGKANLPSRILKGFGIFLFVACIFGILAG